MLGWRTRINELIEEMQEKAAQNAVSPPGDLAERLAARLEDQPAESWDAALWELLDDEEPA